ncbi:MAG: lysophospholipid acyltransferase family protein [Clostridia bacterium]
MFRTAKWMIYFWGFLFLTIPKLRYADKLEFGSDEHKEFVNTLVQGWTRKLIRMSGARINLVGEENIPKEHAVYVANHQGNFDVALMLAMIGEPRSLLAKVEMGKMPIVRDWMRHLGCIFVDRNDPKQGLKAVISAIKYVKAGNSITIFPEGTRSKEGPMGEFKAGSTVVAVKSGALIVPVTIDGSYKILEANKGFKVTPADVNVTIHKPIDPKKLSKEEISDIDNNIKNIIASVL